MVIFIQNHPYNVLKIVLIVPLSPLPHVGICHQPEAWTSHQRASLTVSTLMIQSIRLSSRTTRTTISIFSSLLKICLLYLSDQVSHNPTSLTLIQKRKFPRVNALLPPLARASLAKLTANFDFPSSFNKVITILKDWI